ncbi:MAG: pyrrolo-quinoline quinone, partial [Acidobacteria bacterium]|nr:pyrrolo-quinoline quinone [Acidobacteriota bacterium]
DTGKLAYWNHIVYTFGQGVPIKAWAVQGGLLSNIPAAQSVNVEGGHSGIVSANGTSNGIVWQLQGDLSFATLQAFDAVSLRRIYAATQSGSRDALPATPHFAQLVEINGKIYIGSNSSLVVFGLL